MEDGVVFNVKEELPSSLVTIHSTEDGVVVFNVKEEKCEID